MPPPPPFLPHANSSESMVRYPHHRVVCLEHNAQAVARGRERVVELGLTNATFLHASLYDEAVDDLAFDVGIGLHACGTLSDVILSRCLARGAAFLLVRCDIIESV
jgi:hypothetical protein